MYKQYCPIHCFNYTGSSCPFCEQDKISFYTRKYTEKQNVDKKGVMKNKNNIAHAPIESADDKNITEDMLKQLCKKFNG